MTEKILDLFAGAAGLSLGFESFRTEKGEKAFELFRAVEIDEYACATLRKRYGKEKVIEGDLTDKKIHKKVIEDCKGRVSIIAGGIPCQSFSLIGPRSGHGRNNEKFKKDSRDNLYKEFKSIVQEIKPKVVVIENVKGILSKKDHEGKRIIEKLISEFERIGYAFDNEKGEQYALVNAADYGVPQRRERVILIGVLKKWKQIVVPFVEPTSTRITIKEAIGDLPLVEAKITSTGLSDSKIKAIKRKNERINQGKDRIKLNKRTFQRYLKSLSPAGQEYFNFIRPNGYKFVDHHISRSHQLSDIQLYGYMKEGETAQEFITRSPKLAKKLIKYNMNSFKDKYRKQRSDETSTTVFAHLEKDGNRFIHPWIARTFTPREAARIQSFPDHITFEGSINKKFRQIGNAVPPLLCRNYIAPSVYRILSK